MFRDDKEEGSEYCRRFCCRIEGREWSSARGSVGIESLENEEEWKRRRDEGEMPWMGIILLSFFSNRSHGFLIASASVSSASAVPYPSEDSNVCVEFMKVDL